MSTVTVTYGFKSHKVKASPGVSTADVLEAAAKHFKLPAASYGLFRNDTELSKTLPFRLHFLPAGAKLELKPTETSTSGEITVRVQFINNSALSKQSVIKKVINSMILRDLIAELEKEVGQIVGTGLTLSIATFTKTVGENQLDLTLGDIGVENNGVIRISFRDDNAQLMAAKPSPLTTKKTMNEINATKAPITSETSTPATDKAKPETFVRESPTRTNKTAEHSNFEVTDEPQPNSTHEISETRQSPSSDVMEVDEPTHPDPQEQPQHVYVYKPTTTPITTETPDESTYDFTVSHARQYQAMIARQGHETEKLRKARLAQQKQAMVNIECRVRLPDDTYVQVNFKPDDTCAQLYEFVKSSLLNPDDEFELAYPYPPQPVSNDRTKLKDCMLSRNLLLFKSERKTGAFLKQEFLEKAKDITEAEEVKLEMEGHESREQDVMDETKIKGGMLPKKTTSTKFSGSGSSDGGKKLPKWLKMGKK